MNDNFNNFILIYKISFVFIIWLTTIDNKIKFNKYSIKNVKLFLNHIFLYAQKKISNQVWLK